MIGEPSTRTYPSSNPATSNTPPLPRCWGRASSRSASSSPHRRLLVGSSGFADGDNGGVGLRRALGDGWASGSDAAGGRAPMANVSDAAPLDVVVGPMSPQALTNSASDATRQAIVRMSSPLARGSSRRPCRCRPPNADRHTQETTWLPGRQRTAGPPASEPPRGSALGVARASDGRSPSGQCRFGKSNAQVPFGRKLARPVSMFRCGRDARRLQSGTRPSRIIPQAPRHLAHDLELRLGDSHAVARPMPMPSPAPACRRLLLPASALDVGGRSDEPAFRLRVVELVPCGLELGHRRMVRLFESRLREWRTGSRTPSPRARPRSPNRNRTWWRRRPAAVPRHRSHTADPSDRRQAAGCLSHSPAIAGRPVPHPDRRRTIADRPKPDARGSCPSTRRA